MEKYGELVVTEYPDYDEVEQVLEEITRLDFSYEIDDPKKFEVSIDDSCTTDVAILSVGRTLLCLLKPDTVLFLIYFYAK